VLSKLSRLIPIALIVPLAACGSSGSTHRSNAGGQGVNGPVKIYRVTLSGKGEPKGGAANGSGAAIVAIHGTSQVCFRFAHLHGFSGPTTAHIHMGAQGQAGKVVVALSTAPHLHHQGCRHVSGAVTGALEQAPQNYYVNVHSAQYPKGAVRGQL
jgi:CHRD domain-containing protein